MKRLLASSLLATLALSGCTMLDRKTAPAVAPALKADRAPIKPDEVTAANARDKARSLLEELDRDIDGEF